MPQPPPAPPKREDERFCEARLQLIINTLPATVFVNPIGVVIAAVALYNAQPDFGAVPLSHLAAALGAHLVASFLALLVWRAHPVVKTENIQRLRRLLVGLQFIIGLAWASVCWCFWSEGVAANATFVFIVIAMALWGMALTRCSVRAVFMTGMATVLTLVALRFALSDSRAAQAILVLIPLWTGYMIYSGMATRQKIDDMLTARFANEDLSKELAAAHAVAVQKREEAEQANRTKTTFLANMSHELRTPLNAIIGFSEIIMSQALGPDNARYPEYAGDIHSSGTHLLTLINEILDVAKIEAGRMEIDPRPLHLESALEGIERIMAIRAGEKALDISYTVSPPNLEIKADERAFRQILLNLLSNAVKYTPQGGLVAVECLQTDDGGTLVSVTDNGPGIPADRLAELFKPFSQVDNRFDHAQGGTGLGLALVQGLARLHGGRAWIESTEGHGTSVFVYFPLADVKRELMRAMQ